MLPTLSNPRRLADLYDTKLLARHLPAVFEGDTSLGQVYSALIGGDRRRQARACCCLHSHRVRCLSVLTKHGPSVGAWTQNSVTASAKPCHPSRCLDNASGLCQPTLALTDP